MSEVKLKGSKRCSRCGKKMKWTTLVWSDPQFNSETGEEITQFQTIWACGAIQNTYSPYHDGWTVSGWKIFQPKPVTTLSTFYATTDAGDNDE